MLNSFSAIMSRASSLSLRGPRTTRGSENAPEGTASSLSGARGPHEGAHAPAFAGFALIAYALNRADSTTVRKGWQASGRTTLLCYYGPALDAGHGPEPDSCKGTHGCFPWGVSHFSRLLRSPSKVSQKVDGSGRLVAIQNSTAGQPYVNLGLETF